VIRCGLWPQATPNCGCALSNRAGLPASQCTPESRGRRGVALAAIDSSAPDSAPRILRAPAGQRRREEPPWLQLNDSALEALGGSCPAAFWVPPLETGFILPADEALPTLRDLGVRLPSYTGGKRLVGILVVGAGNHSQALEELDGIAKYGVSERLVPVYAFPGRNVSLAISYVTYAMSGPRDSGSGYRAVRTRSLEYCSPG